MSTRLQRSLYDLFHNSREGLNKIAEWLGKSENTLRKEANPADLTAKCGFVDVVESTVFTGNLVALNAFAAECGCMVLKLPDTASHGDSIEDLARLARGFSDLLAAVSKTVADRRVSDNELKRVEEEAAELVASVQATLHHLSAMNANPRARVAANA